MVRKHDPGQEKRFRKIFWIGLHENRCGERKAHHHDQQKRRQNAESPACSKVENAEPLVLDILGDLIDNQIARDNKKDVDANKSAAKPGQADVGPNNRKNCNRAQAVDKWSVSSNFVN
ncbi:MAG TPA: hypothetical protein VFN63_14830 [Pseudolabrys sp.]|nr:hypothetical protein [Pseudolabrys sp.]